MAIRLNGTREVEVDGLTFQIKPENYLDFVASMDRADRMGVEEKLKNLASMHLGLMERIVGWEGVELQDGSPAPCTDEAKLTLFGMMPTLLSRISEKLIAAEEQDVKNSEPSQAG